MKNQGKGGGGGEGGGWGGHRQGMGWGQAKEWGGDRQRNRQVNAHAFVKLPFSNLPFSFSPQVAGGMVHTTIPGNLASSLYISKPPRSFQPPGGIAAGEGSGTHQQRARKTLK